MILSFNPQVFETDQEEILKRLSQIFDLVLLERKSVDLVDIDSFLSIVFDENGKYIFDEGKFSLNSLSEIDKRRLKDFFNVLVQEGTYIDRSREKYLTTLKIGLQEGEINPEIAFKILKNPSIIIVENATNDWKFVKGVIYKYAKHPTRRSIYMLLKNSLDNLLLTAEQAGGKGQIRNRFEDLKEHRYKDIHRYKIMTLFDSDRSNSNSLNHEINILINYLKSKNVDYTNAIHEDSDLIIWHMFYKRELENYVPVDILINELPLTPEEKTGLTGKTSEELDFTDYEEYLASNKPVNVKNDFPEVFLKEWTRDKIEERCKDHKVLVEIPNGTLTEVSEIEQILLKIAKII
jgi:hypothetical protein